MAVAAGSNVRDLLRHVKRNCNATIRTSLLRLFVYPFSWSYSPYA
jgi:hypothetical protein